MSPSCHIGMRHQCPRQTCPPHNAWPQKPTYADVGKRENSFFPHGHIIVIGVYDRTSARNFSFKRWTFITGYVLPDTAIHTPPTEYVDHADGDLRNTQRHLHEVWMRLDRQGKARQELINQILIEWIVWVDRYQIKSSLFIHCIFRNDSGVFTV